jgi:SAM-dependent methyltransferase
VTGIDVNPDILETARAQARAHHLENISSISGDCRTMQLTEQFDAIVGRLVLLYVDDPAATLRSLVSRLRPGGLVVFQEYNVHAGSLASWPTLPLLEDARHWLEAAATQARLNARIGYDLRRIFVEAGLPEPSMQLDSAVGGGPDWPGYVYGENSIRSMLPLVLASGVATAEEIEIDTLADRMRAATVASGGVIKLPDLVSAWARVP